VLDRSGPRDSGCQHSGAVWTYPLPGGRVPHAVQARHSAPFLPLGLWVALVIKFIGSLGTTSGCPRRYCICTEGNAGIGSNRESIAAIPTAPFGSLARG
jgi:hypothetical protein